jgi:hypothetical protein
VKPLALRVERLRKQPRVMKAGVGGSAGEVTGPLRRALVMRREVRGKR